MKKVLVCDDEKKVHDEVLTALRTFEAFESRFDVHFVMTLAQLFERVDSGIQYDVIVLDGFLGESENTLTFISKLATGVYSHLANSVIVLASSDEMMRGKQFDLLGKDVRSLQEEEGYDAVVLEEWLEKNPMARKDLTIPIPDSIPRVRILQAWETTGTTHKVLLCKDKKEIAASIDMS